MLVKEILDNKTKLIFSAVALGVATLIFFGTGYAFFSDVLSSESQAQTGTLDIVGGISFSQNGESVSSEIANFNPGDVITMTGETIENRGSKSAWVRGVIVFSQISGSADECVIPSDLQEYCSNNPLDPNCTCESEGGLIPGAGAGNLADYLYVCPNGITQDDLISAVDHAALVTLGCQLATVGTEFGASNQTVIDGTVEDETVNDGVNGADNIPEKTLVELDLSQLYFAAFAGNDAQNGAAQFTVKIEALQYRNNNSPDWMNVTETEFSL